MSSLVYLTAAHLKEIPSDWDDPKSAHHHSKHSVLSLDAMQSKPRRPGVELIFQNNWVCLPLSYCMHAVFHLSVKEHRLRVFPKDGRHCFALGGQWASSSWNLLQEHLPSGQAPPPPEAKWVNVQVHVCRQNHFHTIGLELEQWPYMYMLCMPVIENYPVWTNSYWSGCVLNIY